MQRITFPYGKSQIILDIEENRLSGILLSSLQSYKPTQSEQELVASSLSNPIGSARLSDMAKGKKNIVILASDHTRPVPSKIIMPQLLDEIRKGNPNAEITILIATGCHRAPTREELLNKFGETILENERIVCHDCDNSEMVSLGTLPSGGELILNKLAVEADLLVSEGFIEPHFFAGFSGGRKSVLPGIAARKTVLYNHNALFVDDTHSRTGILTNNPLHKDMVFAAQKAKLAFICNVIVNSQHQILYSVAGDAVEAHKKGVEFLQGLCQVKSIQSDIAISTNGGYPLDQNIYQAVKGMTAAEATVKDGGIIIMIAKSNDGHGGEYFFNMTKNGKSAGEIYKNIMDVKPSDTGIDQWQVQVLARVLMKAEVIYVSDAEDQTIRDLHMTPAHTLKDALAIADQKLAKRGIKNGSVVAIPDGVSVMVV